MSGFELLDPAIQHHIVNSLGWPGLRPLQEDSIPTIVDGDDALLLAPTAGGKTEAAMFPVLTRMQAQRWTGTSVLYVCPLKALLNNLGPRLGDYAAWVGRSVAVWHGDVGQSARRRITRERPDILLTTPESVESILVSESVDALQFLGSVQAVVVDEVHAFAGDDRGWHLLAVIARLESLIGRRLQRIGMSATVGNPDELLEWLRGGAPTKGRVVAPPVPTASNPEIVVDAVGSAENAAKVIAGLHHGEKRLVFVDSRRLAEELGTSLRDRGVTTFLSHSSLSAEQRRESEAAFADARDCVIVATSTLELGIDVGDLDRVIQINSPRTVSSFLQRLGRTGRRPGTTRHCLFLALDDASLAQTLGMLHCWASGWVEPVVATPEPRHIAAQQLLAAALQTRRVPLNGWQQQWGTLPLFGDEGQEILDHLLDTGFLDHDAGSAFIGVEAEKHFGRRHFMELLAVFTAAPEFRVFQGRNEIGMVDIGLLTEDVEDVRVLLLGGRSWLVTHIDWKRRQVYVEATDIHGMARWQSIPDGLSYEITRGVRSVLLGDTPAGVTLSRRAVAALDGYRAQRADDVRADSLVIERDSRGDWRWWTWAGVKANRTLAAWARDLVPGRQRIGAESIRLHSDLTVDAIKQGLGDVQHSSERPAPAVDRRAIKGLKFSVALPEDLARRTLAVRMMEAKRAEGLLNERISFRFGSE
ncbi:DEAD/DEAH box helicase [Gordonia desulfuricans]|uniref:DEAD/DEAH box helicase n=1 Tax=Gordonia desulfuricans TaxID=89051 RepID=A0A7K3LPW1_9ACTN|nr:DEAD/DEAH box helicase [Gordonia desulfuricans]NDK90275.1 DEAD/DEAH box helicase [Gordonia desulfuricans]